MQRVGFHSFLLFFALLISPSLYAKIDPLPSWNEGVVKKSIIAFVEKVTTPGSPDYVSQADRIATFDNDGTLWQEKPLPQGVFVGERLKRMVAADPSLLKKNSVRLALKGQTDSLPSMSHEDILELLLLTQSNVSQAQFDAEAKSFLETARHGRWNKRFIDLTYKPMLEVMNLLRQNGFKIYIVSGGSTDFMRQIPTQIYGVGPADYVGSSFFKDIRELDGKMGFWILPKLRTVNDKAQKPINIDLHVGQHPIFAAGNVGGGGDIAMLSYSKQTRGASLQLLVNHDDAKREFSYGEENRDSLSAAAAQGFLVVSMKRDWREIFGSLTRGNKEAAAVSSNSVSKNLKVNDAAPAFAAKTYENKNFDLQSRKGQWTVLYFYPKADTPGCTKQACAFRDSIKKIRDEGGDVFGVSADSVESQAAFHKKNHLNFTLIADPEGKIVELYGAKLPLVKLSKRWTFIIDPDLKIRHIEKDVDPVMDSQRVAAEIARLKKD